jgi:insulysin
VYKDVGELRKITKTSLLEFFNTYVHPSSPKVRKLSAHIQSQKEPEAVKPKINIESLYVCLTSQGVTRYNFNDLKTTVENCESGASTEEILRKLLIDETKANENEIEALISKLVGIMKIDTNIDSGTLISVTPPAINGSMNGTNQNGLLNLTLPASYRDHTQLPPGNTQIEDLNLFKATMELTAAAVPVRPLPRL